MALPRVSANLPPYNPSKSTLAFGNRALPKIVNILYRKMMSFIATQRRELFSNDVEVIQQALLLLADLLHKQENITSACREGIVKSLSSLLLSSSDTVTKYRTSHCLQLIAEHAIGRQTLLDLNIIKDLSKLFTDDDLFVQISAHLAVEMCCRSYEGVQGALKTGLTPVLVDRLLAAQQVNLKLVILDTLHWCLMADPIPGLECQSIERLQPLLDDNESEVRWRVCRCLCDLNIPHDGKRTSVDCKLVDNIVTLLTDADSLVKTHSIAVLMSVSVITDGKYAALETDALDKLIVLLHDISPDVRLNTLKAVTLMAETPEAKEKLKEILDKVQLLKDDQNPVISRAAQTAFDVITWKP